MLLMLWRLQDFCPRYRETRFFRFAFFALSASENYEVRTCKILRRWRNEQEESSFGEFELQGTECDVSSNPFFSGVRDKTKTVEASRDSEKKKQC